MSWSLLICGLGQEEGLGVEITRPDVDVVGLLMYDMKKVTKCITKHLSPDMTFSN